MNLWYRHPEYTHGEWREGDARSEGVTNPKIAGVWAWDPAQEVWVDDAKPVDPDPDLCLSVEWKLTDVELTEVVAILRHNSNVARLREQKRRAGRATRP